jgi:hypothetical protein
VTFLVCVEDGFGSGTALHRDIRLLNRSYLWYSWTSSRGWVGLLMKSFFNFFLDLPLWQIIDSLWVGRFVRSGNRGRMCEFPTYALVSCQTDIVLPAPLSMSVQSNPREGGDCTPSRSERWWSSFYFTLAHMCSRLRCALLPAPLCCEKVHFTSGVYPYVILSNQ